MKRVFVCTYESRARRNGYAPKGTKEFATEWEAVKFKEDMLRNWWCSAAWVTQKTAMETKDSIRDQDLERAMNTVHKYSERFFLGHPGRLF